MESVHCVLRVETWSLGILTRNNEFSYSHWFVLLFCACSLSAVFLIGDLVQCCFVGEGHDRGSISLPLLYSIIPCFFFYFVGACHVMLERG